MSQKNHPFTPESFQVEKKSQGFKIPEEMNKYLRSGEPFKNSSNHDSISIRLEEIKRKYADSNKSSKWYHNAEAPKDKQFNENRDTLSQVKHKSKNNNDSPQKSITKGRGETSASKSPYGSLKHKSFTGSNDL